MQIPVIRGVIDRRILVNFRVGACAVAVGELALSDEVDSCVIDMPAQPAPCMIEAGMWSGHTS
jgi:hypothetical protein